jgi:hypothetical protein
MKIKPNYVSNEDQDIKVYAERLVSTLPTDKFPISGEVRQTSFDPPLDKQFRINTPMNNTIVGHTNDWLLVHLDGRLVEIYPDHKFTSKFVELVTEGSKPVVTT